MPSNIRYAPIPNPHTDTNAQDEMEAAFLESDDEDAPERACIREVISMYLVQRTFHSGSIHLEEAPTFSS